MLQMQTAKTGSYAGKHILIVDHDARYRKYLSLLLSKEGYLNTLAENGHKAMMVLSAESIDLMLLELGLPDLDGRALIGEIREWSMLPILVVSECTTDDEKAEVLDEGADDYIVKPFSSKELLARIRLAFRHLQQYSHSVSSMPHYSLNGLEILPAEHRAFLDGKPVHLTVLEFRLMELLFRYENRVLSSVWIMQQLHGPSYGEDTQALRALVKGLRKKLGDSASNPRFIETENGIGYRLAQRQGQYESDCLAEKES